MPVPRIECLERFQAGSITHLLVLLATADIAVLMTRVGRRRVLLGPSQAASFDRQFAGFLYVTCALVFLRDLRPDRLGLERSLPLHICDLVCLSAAIAMHTRRPLTRAVLHFWGLALSSQASLFPTFTAGPAHSDFWLYWLHHSSIVVAAVYDMTVRQYRPSWRQWRQAILLLGIYTVLIASFDAALGVNYGYLGPAEHGQRPAITAFGPWPDRVPALYLTAVAMMTLMLARLGKPREDLPASEPMKIDLAQRPVTRVAA